MIETATPADDAAIPLADDFTLPLDSVTATFSILGKKGRGKTHTAAVLTEGMVRAGCTTLVIDPTGAWYGLRSAASGNAPGLPVVIFGGRHADVPLAPDNGAHIAEILVDQRFPSVLDLSGLRKGERHRFAVEFLETLYHRNQDPLHLVIDEADEFAPQRAYAGIERLLGATEDIVRRGRVKGIGVTLISQRPAALNKTVLSQVDALIVLGMTAPHDIAAVDDWVSQHSDPEQARALKASLPSLPVGQAWVWSPEWLEITQRISVRRRSTFDSSSTPKAGTKRIEPTRWARVDVAELQHQLADHPDSSSANGKTRIDRLQAQVRALTTELAAAKASRPEPERIEVPVIADAQLREITAAVDGLRELAGELARSADRLSEVVGRARQITRPHPVLPSVPPSASPSTELTRPRPLPQPTPPPDSAVALGKAEREILTVLAQHGTRSTMQVALLTRRSHKSGGFRNSLSKLRTSQMISGRGEITITDTGRNALGTWQPLPQGPALIQWWGTQLGKAERLVLEYLAAHPDHDVPIDEIAEQTGYSVTSGGFRNSLSRLRSLGLAHGRGTLRISTQLVA